MNAPLSPATDAVAGGVDRVLPYASMSPVLRVIRPHEVVPDLDTWVLTEEHVPESSPHEILSDRLKHLLIGWAELRGRNTKIGRNLAFRWDQERPQFGLDPDVYVVEPPPPEGDKVTSLLLWKPGHSPPLLAVEIVSPGHPGKDYRRAPLMYALSGVREVWILDPGLEGPRDDGGPYRIQIWRSLDPRTFALVEAGEDPAWSEAVQGWLRFVPERASYDLSSDPAGADRWLTKEEAAQRRAEAAQRRVEAAQRRVDEERAAREAAQRRAEAAQRSADDERAGREAAQRRVEELEALLARGR